MQGKRKIPLKLNLAWRRRLRSACKSQLNSYACSFDFRTNWHFPHNMIRFKHHSKHPTPPHKNNISLLADSLTSVNLFELETETMQSPTSPPLFLRLTLLLLNEIATTSKDEFPNTHYFPTMQPLWSFAASLVLGTALLSKQCVYSTYIYKHKIHANTHTFIPPPQS